MSDSGNGVARQFGIVFQMDPALKQVKELFGVDVAAYDGDNRYELPVPAAFLVSKAGEVIRSYVEVDYMTVGSQDGAQMDRRNLLASQ